MSSANFFAAQRTHGSWYANYTASAMAQHRDGSGAAHPLVSVVMPVLNEGDHLRAALDAINAQTYPRQRIEILIVDGGSTDTTVEVAHRRSNTDDRIRILGGHGVNTPMAMNVGLQQARGSLVAKIDGHGWMDPEYIERAVRALTDDEALGCVGGRIVPRANGATERAIAMARFSALGVGSGVYTLAPRPQITTTVQCGVYRRDALRAVDGFDPTMAYGEDEELNHRLRVAGWLILMDPAMTFNYRVRRSIGDLYRQYFRYGRARVSVIKKHPRFFRVKHVVPAGTLLGIGFAASLTAAGVRHRGLLALPLGYGSVVAVGSAVLSVRQRFARVDLVAAALVALHVGYGLGSLRGLLAVLTTRRQPASEST